MNKRHHSQDRSCIPIFEEILSIPDVPDMTFWHSQLLPQVTCHVYNMYAALWNPFSQKMCRLVNKLPLSRILHCTISFGYPCSFSDVFSSLPVTTGIVLYLISVEKVSGLIENMWIVHGRAVCHKIWYPLQIIKNENNAKRQKWMTVINFFVDIVSNMYHISRCANSMSGRSHLHQRRFLSWESHSFSQIQYKAVFLCWNGV
jgi:hypothetical protein